MKPKPFSLLNHLTLPCVMLISLRETFEVALYEPRAVRSAISEQSHEGRHSLQKSCTRSRGWENCYQPTPTLLQDGLDHTIRVARILGGALRRPALERRCPFGPSAAGAGIRPVA